MPVEIIPVPVQPDKPKPGGPIQSTSGRVITHPPLQWATIYAPDGSPHRCSPVDAREILAAGAGYTLEPPEVVDEQQPEQFMVESDEAATGGVETAGAEAVTDKDANPNRAQRRKSRS